MILLAIFGGAFVGGVLRYSLSRVFPSPVGTFTSNMLGSLALGLSVGFLAEDALGYALCATGFAGGLSTWSTLAKELGTLPRRRAFRYGFFTLTVGIIAAWRGTIWAARIYHGW